MFIGRETELKFLNDKYNSDGGQLVVLYGRRRVGKTETLREFCKEKPHVFFSCTQTTDRVQLQKFSKQILKENIPAKNYITEFADWEKAFGAVLDLPYGDKKKLFIIDEFPYMCKGNKSIPSILQNLWDTQLRDSNVMIVLCGSAMSFIEKEILAEKNPLYGRATGIFKMKEMGFYDAAKFFTAYSERDKVIAYSVLGGIPHYLRQWNPKLTIEENIKQNILTKGCVLYSEVDFLLHQELRETPVYNSIIEAVALGNTTLNNISQKSLIEDTSKTSVYLKNLIELGIVKREFSVDAKIKEQANGNRGTYKLTDNFFRFWYRFVPANMSAIDSGRIQKSYANSIKKNLPDYMGLTFEHMCRDYLLYYEKDLPIELNQVGQWWGTDNKNKKQVQIDIVGTPVEGDEYIIGSCKYRNEKIGLDELELIREYAQVFGKGKKYYYYIFSKGGFTEGLIQAKNRGEVKLIGLDDLYA